jgi:hypothetical protein
LQNVRSGAEKVPDSTGAYLHLCSAELDLTEHIQKIRNNPASVVRTDRRRIFFELKSANGEGGGVNVITDESGRLDLLVFRRDMLKTERWEN